jgi:transmembrane sensor
VTRRRDLDPELIARFLSGESTPAESALVRAWATDPSARAELDAMQRAWGRAFPLERPIDVDAAWQNVAAAMHAESRSHDRVAPDQSRGTVTRGNLRLHVPAAPRDGRTHALGSTLNRVSRRFPATRLATTAAAAAVLVAMGLGAVRVVRGTWSPGPIAATRQVAAGRTAQDFAAGPGQRALIDLADGTHIVLAPESRLHVSLPTGASGQRELTLDGEALFTVTHDAARPFVVHSRYGTTVDLGTSFAVRAYSGQPYRVVVRDGQVALGVEAAAPVLVAGDVAAAAEDGTLHVAHDPAAAELLDWTSGRLTFKHTRLADLVPQLERWYGVRIHVATPSLRNRRITGQLDTESRAEAMAAIGRTLGAQHTIHGTNVTFSLRGEGR